MHDLMILGAGPAGMTAAVYAARQKAHTLLVSKDVGGQVNWTLGIENYMGYQFIEGVELIQKFEEQVRKFPIEIKIGKDVKRLIRVRNGFEVEADGERHSARTVIVCTGKRPKTLNVPGDGPHFQGMDVAVIGGGNSALEAADNLTKIANHVNLVSISPLTGDNILIKKVRESGKITVMTQHQTLEVTGDGSVSGIRIRDLASGQEKDLSVGGVFVEIGLMPNSDFVRDALTLNELGEIQVNCACETEIAGLYAAGDVTNVPAKQIVVAAGEGAKAAIQAHQFLQKCI
jgi:alkyl hydroperoxide reductase subunit F